MVDTVDPGVVNGSAPSNRLGPDEDVVGAAVARTAAAKFSLDAATPPLVLDVQRERARLERERDAAHDVTMARLHLQEGRFKRADILGWMFLAGVPSGVCTQVVGIASGMPPAAMVWVTPSASGFMVAVAFVTAIVKRRTRASAQSGRA